MQHERYANSIDALTQLCLFILTILLMIENQKFLISFLSYHKIKYSNWLNQNYQVNIV